MRRETPPHRAALGGHEEVCELLLERVAAVDAVDFSGWVEVLASESLILMPRGEYVCELLG